MKVDLGMGEERDIICGVPLLLFDFLRVDLYMKALPTGCWKQHPLSHLVIVKAVVCVPGSVSDR